MCCWTCCLEELRRKANKNRFSSFEANPVLPKHEINYDLFYYVNKYVQCCISWCLYDQDVKNTLWNTPAFHDPKGVTSTCQLVHILLHKEARAS
jgi:hypothetical protein